jgi:hypothetical protein
MKAKVAAKPKSAAKTNPLKTKSAIAAKTPKPIGKKAAKAPRKPLGKRR